MYRRYIKRLLDFILAFIGLIVLSPLLLVVMVWLYFANKGAGVFFHQKRPGVGEKLFNLYKFKSMTDERDAEGNLLPEAERVTPVGSFIRKTSIDELPQLWNVLRGDMALIGPRPQMADFLPYYTQREHLRHSIRPGITGLAQVSGRTYLPWDDRLELDVQYVEQYSFLMDVKILYKTVLQVIKQKDIEIVPANPRMDLERIAKGVPPSSESPFR